MGLLPVALDSIVAIGYCYERKTPTWGATGFLVCWPVEQEGVTLGHYIFLVTNKHVLEGENSIVARLRVKVIGSQRITIFRS
jgi:hypothetical protein